MIILTSKKILRNITTYRKLHVERKIIFREVNASSRLSPVYTRKQVNIPFTTSATLNVTMPIGGYIGIRIVRSWSIFSGDRRVQKSRKGKDSSWFYARTRDFSHVCNHNPIALSDFTIPGDPFQGNQGHLRHRERATGGCKKEICAYVHT